MRKYLPTLSELIDRLSITQLKEVFISDHKEEYSEEIKEKHTSPTNPVLFSEKITTDDEKKQVEDFRNKVINEVGNNDTPNFYQNEKISV